MTKFINGLIGAALAFLPFLLLYLAVVKPTLVLVIGAVVAVFIGYYVAKEYIIFDTITLSGVTNERDK